jgi:hypothetical protein
MSVHNDLHLSILLLNSINTCKSTAQKRSIMLASSAYQHVFDVDPNANANAKSGKSGKSSTLSGDYLSPKNIQKNFAALAWKLKADAKSEPVVDLADPVPQQITFKPKYRLNEYEENFEFCDNEIKKVLAKKTWNSMDKCFKWGFIQDYLVEFEWITDEKIAAIKGLFMSNAMKEIVFSNKERKITSLNIEFDHIKI